jgi:Flp pilus assembly protein TadB
VSGSVPALVLLALALLAWPPAGAMARLRLSAMPGARIRGAPRLTGGNPRLTPSARRWLWAVTAGAAVAALLGGPPGLVLGVVVAVGAERLLRRAVDDDRRRTAELGRDLPVACELLAVCLGAGVPLGAALHEVGTALPGPAGQELVRVAGLYRLGAEPRHAWSDVPAQFAPLGRVVVRAGETGARAVPALQALATDARSTARADTDTAVRRAGVWVLAPLGACFLPAFLCLGVVPLVLGIAGDVFG